MKKTPELLAHLEWLGYIQPVGLVVSAPALLNAQAHINTNIVPEHRRFLEVLPKNEDDEPIAEVADFHSFVQSVFGWEREDLRKLPLDSLPADFNGLEIVLPEYNETLRPTYVVPAFEPAADDPKWIALVKEYPADIEFDDDEVSDNRRWQASPHSRFERLLRETEIPFGILTNGRSIRLVYAPRGETSGYLTFNLNEMISVAGRPIFAAMHLLLGAPLMFANDKHQRLTAILADSRKYQNTVSTELAEQVMAALFDMLRGFQSASDATGGKLLDNVLAKNPQHVYHALVTVLMRMVFVLYAEDRGLVSSDPVYTNHYSVSGLFERLRQDYGRFPDTMDQRFGAWAQLLALFRMVYEGGSHNELKIPAREGYLFDYQRFPFLEGRFDDGNPRILTQEEIDSPINVPRVSDGVVYRMLNNLLILQGERLSYRTLDVEQIGSVYETIMGFSVEVSSGKSIAIKPAKKHGAPSTINLEELLEVADKDRSKWIKERTDQKLSAGDAKAVKAAKSFDELLGALDKKRAHHVTPDPVPGGAMVFQPSDERRRSGSHYTPRSLTEPIVKTTLGPILKQLVDAEADPPSVWEPESRDKKRFTKGEIAARIRLSEKQVENILEARKVGVPHPSQLLDLKICDPAMGSGAFLVEVCRQLADELVKSWYAHDLVPRDIPPDEDELLYARRLIAQRCLYGVDKNIMAVELAKLSLWLVTLAKDHSFTFLDHSLRYGDTLVGLTREQIIGFHWEVKKQKKFGEDQIQKRLDKAIRKRARILNAREDVPYRDQEQQMAGVDSALDLIRLVGDACVSGFFAGKKKKEREEEVERLFGLASNYLASKKKQVIDHDARKALATAVAELRSGEHAVPPFHWEIEFPEVFSRENGGFDAFVGNPPFAGKNTFIKGNGKPFLEWLKLSHPESHGNSDVVAHFFRRAFSLLNRTGSFGLIATNTIGQGDTRATGLRWICSNGGEIYCANRRVKWPGVAAVIVSTIHVSRSESVTECQLDGKKVDRITAFLFHAGGHDDPHQLAVNKSRSYIGSYVLGMGFMFDDSDSKAIASPLSRMRKLIETSPRNKDRIFPFIGGEEINDDPQHAYHRYVINFADMSLEQANEWPALVEIIRERVKPDRDKLADNPDGRRRKKYWWQWGRYTPSLFSELKDKKRTLACAQTSKFLAFAFLDPSIIFSHYVVVLTFEEDSAFAVVQSQVHQVWASFFGTTLEDRPRYTPSDCFDTYPFPEKFLDNDSLEHLGKTIYEYRAALMVETNEGLTKTYNRFHDPNEQSEGILELRRLHGLMDEAVLRAYGWDDLAESATCEFLLDYEEEESDEPGAKKSKKKKPWRYRWPDEFRDEVLARLLELNEQRHKEELLAGGVVEGKKTKKAKDDSTEKKQKAKGLFDDLPELDGDESLVLMAVQEIGTMTRFTLDNAFCLLKSTKCRKSRLGLGDPPKSTPKTPAGMNGIVGRLISDGWLKTIPSKTQQILAVGDTESPLGKISKANQTKLDQVKQIFQQAMEADEPKLDKFEVEDDMVGDTNALKITKEVFDAKESLLV